MFMRIMVMLKGLDRFSTSDRPSKPVSWFDSLSERSPAGIRRLTSIGILALAVVAFSFERAVELENRVSSEQVEQTWNSAKRALQIRMEELPRSSWKDLLHSHPIIRRSWLT